MKDRVEAPRSDVKTDGSSEIGCGQKDKAVISLLGHLGANTGVQGSPEGRGSRGWMLIPSRVPATSTIRDGEEESPPGRARQNPDSSVHGASREGCAKTEVTASQRSARKLESRQGAAGLSATRRSRTGQCDCWVSQEGPDHH